MATVEVITEIKPHPNADRLELVKVLGYQVVCQIGLHKVGEKVVYIQPDNFLPARSADQTSISWADEYRKYSPSRIRAIKLRGEWSEGLIVPLQVLSSITNGKEYDVTELLGITHYQEQSSLDESLRENESSGGDIGTCLPFGIPKTDEVRFEMIRGKIASLFASEGAGAGGEQLVDVTLKIDGQSMSVYYHLPTDTFGVAGRKRHFTMGVDDNSYTQNVVRYDLEKKLRSYCKSKGVSLCLRGESYGAGIQNLKHNPHCKLPKGFAAFSVYLIDDGQAKAGRYAQKGDPFYYVNVCKELGLPRVPMLEENVPLTDELCRKYAYELKTLDATKGFSETESQVMFEGVVIKCSDFSFKVISKHYDSLKV